MPTPGIDALRIENRVLFASAAAALASVAKQFRSLASCACLCLVSGLVYAEPAADFAIARKAFETVQLDIVVDIEELDPELRGAAWEQYYTALEQLHRMDVHQQMMARHDLDRTDEFAAALAEFELALEQLERLLEKRGAD